MIIKRLELGMFASNCYVIGSESTKEGLVIDPGDEPNRILNSIKALGLDIKLILVTHGHIDHISAVNKVKEATGAEVAIHADDVGALKGGGWFLGIPRPTVPPPERLLNDGDNIDVADLHFKVLHTPGHSPGGVCFLGDGVVFTGDTLFCQSIGRSDIGEGNHRQLINSIMTRLMTLPDKTIVYPGHGPETTIGEERRSNPFLQGY